MNECFRWCVDLLIWLAKAFGITYEEVNVWLFVIIWPIVTAVLIMIIAWQWKCIRMLRRKYERNSNE